MNDPRKNLQIYAEELSNSDYWVTITSRDGVLKLFTNSPPEIITMLLYHASRYLEGFFDDGDEHLLPPTIQ